MSVLPPVLRRCVLPAGDVTAACVNSIGVDVERPKQFFELPRSSSPHQSFAALRRSSTFRQVMRLLEGIKTNNASSSRPTIDVLPPLVVDTT